MISPKQIKSARVWLGWTQEELAKQCNLSKSAIAKIEAEEAVARPANLQRIQNELEKGGIDFTHNGIRERDDLIRMYMDRAGYRSFFNDVYYTAKETGGEILVSGVEETKFDELLADDLDMHVRRMNRLPNLSFKVLISENDQNTAGESYIDYRALPEKYFTSIPFYLYGNKVAILLWRQPARIMLLTDDELHQAFRSQFYSMWDMATPASS
jgi:transcriptional regulator with XRE-family HTH domain